MDQYRLIEKREDDDSQARGLVRFCICVCMCGIRSICIGGALVGIGMATMIYYSSGIKRTTVPYI